MSQTGEPEVGSLGGTARARPAARTVAEGALVTLVAALVLNYVLSLSTWWNVNFRLWWLGPLSAKGFLLDTAVVWFALLLLVALVGRMWLAIGLLLSFVLLVSAANDAKVRLRLEPILPSDLDLLTSASDLLAMVSTTDLVGAVVLVVVILGGAWLLGRRIGRRRPNPLTVGERGRRVRWQLRRAVLGLVALLVLLPLGSFHGPRNPWGHAYQAMGVAWQPWEQRSNYQVNGFVAGFLDNLHIDPMTEPAGYSKATMRDLVERYQRRAEEINATRTQDGFAGANVVVVLSESFADPTRLRGVRVDEDPIPVTHATMDESRSGSMISTGYGGGTADMEFQTVTGLSTMLFAPTISSAFQDVVVQEPRVPSAAWWFRSRGYDSVSLEAYTPQMYQSGRAYPRLGYGHRIYLGQMRHTARVNASYVADSSVFAEVIDRLHEHQRPTFLSAVTMQNHYPWENAYPHPVAAPRLPGGETNAFRNYLTGIGKSDAAMRDFLEQLRGLDEKTVVIFYGDHQPGFWPDQVRAANGDRAMHETPYFIWSNYRRLGPAHAEPPTGPSTFLPLALEAVGGTVPPMYALLTDVRAQVAALGRDFAVLSDDSTTSMDRLPESAKQVLRDYRLVQYDFTRGHRWAEKGLWGTSG